MQQISLIFSNKFYFYSKFIFFYYLKIIKCFILIEIVEVIMLNPIQPNFAIKPNLQRRNNISFGTKIDPDLKDFVNGLV